MAGHTMKPCKLCIIIFVLMVSGCMESGWEKISDSSTVNAVSERQNLLPAFKEKLVGNIPLQVKNPNSFAALTGVRSGRKGVNFNVPANDAFTVYLPNGTYDVYFVYSDRPDSLFQGDPITLYNNGMEIQLVQIVNGNYHIRQVK